MLDFINKMENEDILNKYKKMLNETDYLFFEDISTKISKDLFQGLIDFCYLSSNTFDSSFLDLSKESKYESLLSKKYDNMEAIDVLSFKIELIDKDKVLDLNSIYNIKDFLTNEELKNLFVIFEKLSDELGVYAFVSKNKTINKSKI